MCFRGQVFSVLRWSIRRNVFSGSRYRFLSLWSRNRNDPQPENFREIMHVVEKVRCQDLRTLVWPVSQKGHLTTRNHETAALLEPKTEGDPPLLSHSRQFANDFDQGQRMWFVKGAWISRNIFSIRSIRSACAD